MLSAFLFARNGIRALVVAGASAGALLFLPACGEAIAPPRIEQIAPDPPHAMEFVHRAKTSYALTTPNRAGHLTLWWRSITRDGVVDHGALVVDPAVDDGKFEVFVTSCGAVRFFRYPIRASIGHGVRQESCRLDFDQEILHAGTVRPLYDLTPGRDVTLQQARFFFRSNPLFAGGIGPYIPPATTTADVIMELHARLTP